MNKKKVLFSFIFLIIVISIGVFLALKFFKKPNSQDTVKEIKPTIGTIKTVISTTGTVLPKNRLEIKPPVNGRVEKILVLEGDMVKTGQTLAWMSSTDRAALLDAARGQSAEELKYWEDTYKPIALLAPIDGEVIVATTQPGQTVTASDAVLVLSDHLIVRAQVDETDIGKIKLDQKAVVTLDAYPDTKIDAIVEHIYYESQTVNNVTIYNVDLRPEKVPDFFRSGMNASVDFTVESKENLLIIPQEAVHKTKEGDFVLVKKDDKEPAMVKVTLGASDDKNTEVLSGVAKDDTIVITSKKFVLPSAESSGGNPFMPFGRRR
ncbi:MAG: HlyD family efflux transporter periplasmic adaptor subunit [Candidatus Omnitrophica bacterium]|nr:HlyD family efflux transporter periplasmic adaptor subunit [Candidatus Omnitrophota bacterium]MDD5653825.1 HlyD family efflux transporter periplasmic adaptor subunit [Candidatus Omnitrophota bacterium]